MPSIIPKLVFAIIYIIVPYALVIAFWVSNTIRSRCRRTWEKQTINRHPELKKLLFDYRSAKDELSRISYNIDQRKRKIDTLFSQNRYLPSRARTDTILETLREELLKLDQEYAQACVLKQTARKELEKFWETNYPNLEPDKRIMQWEDD